MSDLIKERLIRLVGGMVAVSCLCVVGLEYTDRLNMDPKIGLLGCIGIALWVGLTVLGGDSHE